MNAFTKGTHLGNTDRKPEDFWPRRNAKLRFGPPKPPASGASVSLLRK